MGAIVLILGLVLVFVGVLALRRGRIRAGGRFLATRVTGQAVRYIAVPQVIAGSLAVVVGAAQLVGFDPLGQYATIALYVVVATYLVTNLGVGAYFQAREGMEETRKPAEETAD